MNRLLAAYRSLWDRHPGVTYYALLTVMIGSLACFFLEAIELSPLAVPAALVLAAAIMLLRLAPDDDTPTCMHGVPSPCGICGSFPKESDGAR